MLRRDRHQRGYLGQDMLVTKVLIGLMVLVFIVERFPAVLAPLLASPVGILVSMLLSALSPGGFLGLIFAGLFLWIIGSQLESLTTWWQYVLIFFASGIIGSLAANAVGGGAVGGTFAAFGLAGAFVMAMASRRVGGMAQWAIFLLAFNVVLSGFQLGLLAGMLGAFATGLVIARLSHV